MITYRCPTVPVAPRIPTLTSRGAVMVAERRSGAIDGRALFLEDEYHTDSWKSTADEADSSVHEGQISTSPSCKSHRRLLCLI